MTTTETLSAKSVNEAAAAMHEAYSRNEILLELLAGCLRELDGLYLLSVQGRQLRGMMAVSSDGALDRSQIQQRTLQLTPLSVATRVSQDGILYLGPIPDTDPCGQLFSRQQLTTSTMALLPTLLGGRVICIVAGPCREKATARLQNALSHLAHEASLAFGNLILRAKGVLSAQDDAAAATEGLQQPAAAQVTVPAAAADVPEPAQEPILLTKKKRKKATLPLQDLVPLGDAVDKPTTDAVCQDLETLINSEHESLQPTETPAVAENPPTPPDTSATGAADVATQTQQSAEQTSAKEKDSKQQKKQKGRRRRKRAVQKAKDRKEAEKQQRPAKAPKPEKTTESEAKPSLDTSETLSAASSTADSAVQQQISQEGMPPDGGALVRFPQTIQVDHQSEHNFFTGFMEDIGEGGLFVATHTTVPIGETLELNFTVPGLKKSCTISCRVRWVREYDPTNEETVPGMGLSFLKLPDPIRSVIETFIRQRDPIFFED